MKTQKNTPVIKFVKLARDYAASSPHSWTRLNQDVRSACIIAASGFPWQNGDLDEMMKITGTHICLGEQGAECLYTAAVENNNISACREIERYMGRRPIIADNLCDKKRGRLCIGTEFNWKNQHVRVTSFNGDHHAVCCSYEDKFACPAKIKRRFTISAEDVQKERKAEKAFSSEAKKKKGKL